MKLTSKEATILACVELHANDPISTCQKQTGYREHAIRYVLQKLEDQGAIRKVPFVDMYPLGYQDFGLYFSLASLQSKAKTDLLRILSHSPFITLLLELGGDYQYCAGMYVKHISEFMDILDRLSEQAPQLFFDKSFTMRVSMTRFRRKYLCPDLPIETMSFGENKEQVNIDTLDEKILFGLSKHGSCSQRELATKTGVPFSTLHYHLSELTRKQIFRGMTYAITPSAIGMQAFQILIYAKGLRHRFQEELFAFVRDDPRGVYFVRCIGAWDFEIGVEVELAE